MKVAKTATLICSAIILLATVYPAGASPVIDGVLEWDEGYETGNWVYFNVGNKKKQTQMADRGKLWTYRDDSGDLYVNLTLPVSLVDNTYGRKTAGWGQKNRRHRFRDLEKSDSARFAFTNLSGDVVFDFSMDYLSRNKKNKNRWSSFGVGGRDGKVHRGKADSLLDWSTSLDYNFNELGYVLTKDSPSVKDLGPNGKYSGWRNEVTYEFRIDGSILGNHALIGVDIPYLHISPNKVGGNTVYAMVGETIPEPATICLLGLGSLCLFRKRRHRKTC